MLFHWIEVASPSFSWSRLFVIMAMGLNLWAPFGRTWFLLPIGFVRYHFWTHSHVVALDSGYSTGG